MINLDQIIELAQEMEQQDPIDWHGHRLDPNSVYKMLGSSVLEQVQKQHDPEMREAILMASLVKLTVENFVLELKQQENDI